MPPFKSSFRREILTWINPQPTTLLFLEAPEYPWMPGTVFISLSSEWGHPTLIESLEDFSRIRHQEWKSRTHGLFFMQFIIARMKRCTSLPGIFRVASVHQMLRWNLILCESQGPLTNAAAIFSISGPAGCSWLRVLDMEASKNCKWRGQPNISRSGTWLPWEGSIACSLCQQGRVSRLKRDSAPRVIKLG